MNVIMSESLTGLLIKLKVEAYKGGEGAIPCWAFFFDNAS